MQLHLKSMETVGVEPTAKTFPVWALNLCLPLCPLEVFGRIYPIVPSTTESNPFKPCQGNLSFNWLSISLRTFNYFAASFPIQYIHIFRDNKQGYSVSVFAIYVFTTPTHYSKYCWNPVKQLS